MNSKNQKTTLESVASDLRKELAERYQCVDIGQEGWRDIFTVVTTQTDVINAPQDKTNAPYPYKTYGFSFELSAAEAEKRLTKEVIIKCDALFCAIKFSLEREAYFVFDEILTAPKFEKNRWNTIFCRGVLKEILRSVNRAQDDEGKLLGLTPKILLISPQLRFEAYNKITLEYFEKLGINVVVSDFFKKNTSNPSAWFVITDAAHGFKCFERQKPELRVFARQNGSDGNPVVCFEVTARYSFGCTNPNAVFSSTGAVELY